MKIFRLHKTWMFAAFVAGALACTPAFAKKSKAAEDDIYRTDTARMVWKLINDNAQ